MSSISKCSWFLCRVKHKSLCATGNTGNIVPEHNLMKFSQNERYFVPDKLSIMLCLFVAKPTLFSEMLFKMHKLWRCGECLLVPPIVWRHTSEKQQQNSQNGSIQIKYCIAWARRWIQSRRNNYTHLSAQSKNRAAKNDRYFRLIWKWSLFSICSTCCAENNRILHRRLSQAICIVAIP